jgi:hypothetical protein
MATEDKSASSKIKQAIARANTAMKLYTSNIAAANSPAALSSAERFEQKALSGIGNVTIVVEKPCDGL